MGNRAIVAFEVAASEGFNHATRAREIIPARVEPFGIYLHWNGGPESVWGFLDALTVRQKDRGGDIAYGAARLVEIIGRFFGGSNSLGLAGFTNAETKLLTKRSNADAQRTKVDRAISPGDAGIYVVGWSAKRFAVVGRFVGVSDAVTTGARWLTDNEITREEAAAREHSYFTGPETLLDAIARANAFPDAKLAGRAA